MSASRLEISLGPVLFNWPAATLAAFYERMADHPDLDRVYLGEVVCGKRTPLHAEVIERAAERLRAAGKQVVRSSLAMPTTPRERSENRRLGERPDLVEINDVSALAGRAGGPFVAGPLLNIYNEAAALDLIGRGCVRLCTNVELPLDAIAQLAQACPGLEIELFAYGRLPLALSGRCYHARAHGRTKDTCQFACDQDPDGMPVRTVEGAPFLAVNGVQTLSHGLQVVDVAVARLRGSGVHALRLSPHTGNMAAIISAYRRYADGEPVDLAAVVRAATPLGDPVGGYLRGEAGLRAAALP